ncbi:MAG: hypothetical protein QOF13_913 [Solirubrobacterales bacterium]|jgi:hypothetical protein|nr:hypothetical protein [Solirubrobacterales bacterium]
MTALVGRRAIRCLGPTVLALAMALTPHAALGNRKAGVNSQKTIARAETTVGFWAGEAVPGTDWDSPDTYWKRRDTHFYTPRLWRVLRRNRVPLYFNLRYRRDFGPVPPGKPQRHDALRIIRTANRLGVPVWGWVLIPYSDGYWAWEGAAAEQFKAVKALVRWAREKRVRLQGLALDPEPRLRTPFEATAAIMGGSGGGAFSSVFQPTIDPAGQCAAWRGYARIPRWARRHDVRVSAAPMPAALDDIGDGSLALQDAANFILPVAGWDELYFQAYRSVFSYYSGHDPGPSIISSYFRSAQREYGSVGQISLGSSGRGPYRRLSSLIGDVRLAATLGAREVPIYSLERTLRAYGGPRSVTRLVRAAQQPFAGPAATRSIAPTPRASTLRAAIRRADKAATVSTRPITASRGASLPPNPSRGGCGQGPLSLRGD